MCSPSACTSSNVIHANWSRRLKLFIKPFVEIGPNKKNSCVQVSLPTLILGPTLKMLNFF